MFRLTQVGPTGSDCTALYHVDLNREYTVEQFIQDVISNDHEWSCIGIYDAKHIFGHPRCEYRYGTLLTQIPPEYLKRRVLSAQADGGWSLMNYTLTLED